MAMSGIGATGSQWQDGVMETGATLVKTGIARSLARLAGAVLDQLYPPVCLSCDAPIASADTLCPACFRQLRPITAPLCPVLGLPFTVSLGPTARSAEAIADPPPFDRARSAVVYNDIARALVGKLKYGDRPELARFCARLMAQAGHELWGEGAVLLPVPLHRTRQFARRYNQSTSGSPVSPSSRCWSAARRRRASRSGSRAAPASAMLPVPSRRIPRCWPG
jgi:predicted amidophosphoribosyltransferase